jgi:putative peptidoglycan lipid II flippase
MVLKGALAGLLLMLGSRVLGLLRESALAATFGATAMADLAVTLIGLPDLLVGLMAAGALSLVLLPHWAAQEPAQRWRSQQRAMHAGVLAVLVAAAVAAVAWPLTLRVLSPGVLNQLPAAAVPALWLALLASPMAMAASVWATRSQAESDMVGFFGGNFIFNAFVMSGLVLAAWGLEPAALCVGGAVLLACAVRAAWSWHRVKGVVSQPLTAPPHAPRSRSQWLWLGGSAVIVSATPMLLPVAARAAASEGGAGDLAVFAYAWKLVELPWMAGIQLVASIAFARVATVVHADGLSAGADGVLMRAFGVALAVSLVTAALLLFAAAPLASGLFGWGRMVAHPEELAEVTRLASEGAWALPALAISAVGATVIASAGRLHAAALGFAGVAGMTLLGLELTPASQAMTVLVIAQWALALATVACMRPVWRRLLAQRATESAS